MSESLQPHQLKPTSLLSPWDSPGKNTGVGCHFLIFPTQGLNPSLLHLLLWQASSLLLVPNQFSQFSRTVMSDSLRPHGLQQARPPCPSPTPGAYSNACPQSWWCHPTISSSIILISSHLQSFPASGSFQMSQLFASGGQSIGVSVLASVLPMNIQDWFP